MHPTYQPRHRRSFSPRSIRRGLIVVASLAVALVGGLMAQSSASATTAPTTGKTQVVDITFDVAALPLTNLCNKDVVNLHGTAHLRTATTPTSNGGMRVASSLREINLTGQRITPPMYGYTGDNTENTYSYTAPPPYPTTVRLVHWTKLVPRYNAPSMWLVVVVREVINADGTTVPAPERAYLTCTQPPSHDCHRVN
jgi:hypothetical protein